MACMPDDWDETEPAAMSGLTEPDAVYSAEHTMTLCAKKGS